MALINRVSRLFKADFHAVLDQIEEPEQILKQAIRDMEDELQEAEQRVASCEHECEQLGKRQAILEDSIADTDSQLDLCFGSGKDDLARGLIRKQLESQRLLKHLGNRLDDNAAFLADQRRLLDENRATLDGLRQKAEVFATRSPVASAGPDPITALSGSVAVTDDEVEIAFLREQARRKSS